MAAAARLDGLLDILVACHELPPALHTTDGHFASEDFLAASLVAHLDARGFASIHLLPQLLCIGASHADRILDRVLADRDRSLLLLDDYVFSRTGLDALQSALRSALVDDGWAGISSLASRLKVSTALVHLLCDDPALVADLGLEREENDSGTVHTRAYRERVSEILVSACSGVHPVNLQIALQDTTCPQSLWKALLRSLISSGTLVGHVHGTAFTPQAHLDAATDAALATFDAAGFLPNAQLTTTVRDALARRVAAGTHPAPWTLAAVTTSATHMRHVADLVEGAAETDPSVVVDALGVAPCIADAPDARAFVVRAFAPSRATTSPTPTHSSSRRGGGNSAPAHTAHPWVIAGSKVADRRRLTVACVKSARTAVLRDLAEREARGGDLTTPCEVTRAMIAKHLTWVPGEMREAVNGDVVRLLQAAADRARAHRSDPQAALLYWSTRLAVYREFGLEKFATLGVPKALVKKLDRHLMRTHAQPMIPAVIALLSTSSVAPKDAEIAGVRAALETAVSSGKSSSLVGKLIGSVAVSAGAVMPTVEEVEQLRVELMAQQASADHSSSLHLTPAMATALDRANGHKVLLHVEDMEDVLLDELAHALESTSTL